MKPSSLDSVEFTARLGKAFSPRDVDVASFRKNVPLEAFERSYLKALVNAGWIVFTSYASLYLASKVYSGGLSLPHYSLSISFWLFYYVVQPLLWGGFWVIGHDSVHNTLTPSTTVNQSVGFVLNSTLFIPHFAWRITHLRHHRYVGHIDKDYAYVPYTRSEYGLPPEETAKAKHYEEIFDDAPIVVFLQFLYMQLLGHHSYFLINIMGSKGHPKANHYNPKSAMFGPQQRQEIIISDIGVAFMGTALLYWALNTSFTEVLVVYIIPFFLANHWIVAMTFLQHSCPSVPFYREDEWTRTRGTFSTIDRPFLGWVGIYVLLGVNHYHTAHHLFPNIPFYNLPSVHLAIKPLFPKDMYNYDDTPVLWALWRSFKSCMFVEDHGNIVFYKDREGEACRQLVSTEGHE